MTDSNNENVLVLYFHSKRKKIKSLCATGLNKKERTTHFGQNTDLLVVTSSLESSASEPKPFQIRSKVESLG